MISEITTFLIDLIKMRWLHGPTAARLVHVDARRSERKPAMPSPSPHGFQADRRALLLALLVSYPRFVALTPDERAAIEAIIAAPVC